MSNARLFPIEVGDLIWRLFEDETDPPVGAWREGLNYGWAANQTESLMHTLVQIRARSSLLSCVCTSSRAACGPIRSLGNPLISIGSLVVGFTLH